MYQYTVQYAKLCGSLTTLKKYTDNTANDPIVRKTRQRVNMSSPMSMAMPPSQNTQNQQLMREETSGPAAGGVQKKKKKRKNKNKQAANTAQNGAAPNQQQQPPQQQQSNNSNDGQHASKTSKKGSRQRRADQKRKKDEESKAVEQQPPKKIHNEQSQAEEKRPAPKTQAQIDRKREARKRQAESKRKRKQESQANEQQPSKKKKEEDGMFEPPKQLLTSRMRPKKKQAARSKKKKEPEGEIFRPQKPVNHPNKVLEWYSTLDPVPVQDEQAMAKVVFLGRAKEHGMLRDQTKERIASIQNQCDLHHMTVGQACSFRRHLILQKNKFPNAQEKMGLGSETVIRKAATIFEDCIGAFLDQQKIPFFSETDQHRMQPNGCPNPDSLLRETVTLQCNKGGQAGVEINWVECKMFYGASTIPLNNKSAVGRILTTANKYVKLFGPGAICFRHGCGAQLASQLEQVGVVALDADTVDLSKLEAHSRTWCAGPDGTILPWETTIVAQWREGTTPD